MIEKQSDEIFMENDIDYRPFAGEVHSCFPPVPWFVSDEDMSNLDRHDLRHVHVFSVTPKGCKDIDNALHFRALRNGNYEVGFHIAGVTNFVHHVSPLDNEASKRGNSVYLVEGRVDMLPKPLTQDICSLRSDFERLAFSVLWEMTPDTKIISTKFTKSIIKSRTALSYDEAQARMDYRNLVDPLTTDLRNLNALAKIMRQKRVERGALTLVSAEAKFKTDIDHDLLDIGMYQIGESKQMVEEFMLAANVSVAKQIRDHFPGCALLRHHPTPTPEMLEPLLCAAAAVGLADSLDRAVDVALSLKRKRAE